MGHRLLQVARVAAVLGYIRARKLGEAAGRRKIGPEHRVERAARTLRQAAVAGVLELLHAERERDIAGSGSNRVDRAAKSFGAAGAVVLHPRHRNEGQSQSLGERNAGLAHMLLLDRSGEPGGLDLVLPDAGVHDRLLEGFDHQIVGFLVPALAEFRTAHAENRNLVTYAASHFMPPSRHRQVSLSRNNA